MSDQPTTDDGFDDIVQMVDEPSYAAPQWLRARMHTEHRLPILPPWLTDRQEFRRMVLWAVAYVAYVAKYHAIRVVLGVYLARALHRAGRGLGRVTITAARWCRDELGAAALAQVNENKQPELHHKLDEQHRDHVRDRTRLVVAAAVAVVAAAAFVVASGDVVTQVAAATAGVGVLAAVGQDRDHPIIDHAVTPTKVEKLTAPVIERALRSISGVGGLNKGDVTFPSDPVRDGPGWRADVDLPHGVTVSDIAERREQLASGLRRPAGAVWVEPSPGQHAGRMVLWVGDEAVSERKPAPWPLVRKGTVDLFADPFVFGYDPRERPVTINLDETNVLIGSLPGAGKTSAARLLNLAAALDRRAELHVFELKGTGDLEALEDVAYRYGSGPDEATVDACMDSLRYVHADLERRAERIKGLPREQCPDGKVTSQLASRRELGLHPLVMTIDECQELFTHPEFGGKKGEAARLCTSIIKRGRALGVILILATQRPDADSLPTGISANAGTRFCLRVMGQTENDMILGTSMYRNGYSTVQFSTRDKGLGVLVGAHEDPVTARTAYVDKVQAAKVAARARALRASAGLLSGHAAGEEPLAKDDRARLLADVLSVVPQGEDKVWSETVCDRLASAWPDRYGRWEQTGDKKADESARGELAVGLKRFGVHTRQVWFDGQNKNGVHRDDLEDAAERV